YAAPRNAAVEQGIEPGGEDFGPIHQAVEDSRGIVDPRAGEGECGEVEGQGGDGGVAVGNKNCFLDWYYQGYEASMADERREAEAERRNFERMGEARFRGVTYRSPWKGAHDLRDEHLCCELIARLGDNSWGISVPHYGVIVAKEAKTPGGSDLIHKEAPIPTMVTTTQDRKGPVFCAVCFD
ncbi:hypothetical protein FOZ63_001531, partial [Perkinsus olseni]